MIGHGTDAERELDVELAIVPEPFDSEVLHLRIARIKTASSATTVATAAWLEDAAERSRRAGYDQLLCRAALGRLPDIWALERTGFELMDVGVTFARTLRGSIELPDTGDLLVRPSTDDDVREIVRTMVDEPWGSRYEADPAYAPSDVRELRTRWLWNSHNGRADVMLVGVLEGQAAGYVTCRLDKETGHGDIELVGTLPAFRGRRVAARMLQHAIAWFSTRTTLVTVRTQATNYAAAALYERGGFTLHSSDLTFRLDLRRPSRIHS